jgi:hypothetical protein
MRDQLKTSYSDGTTHVLFELLDFIAWLTTRDKQTPRDELVLYASYTP